ncbi:response regulator [Leptolyngbya sp. FACHB-261]|uniref:response regulator n=1 Tax=Leptolyngbya sp. FACHB-261 TaxID=2692806 RepID=UPI0016891B4B|nr:response regulator [Leptolyngbya sp. FACHB-261]MBD2104023.1 response regulator [Leptolyngbya sp. FACHB-261]
MSRVLVIDDVPSQQDLICRMLQEGGISVIRASSGEEGLNRIRKEKPDLLILDIVMPRMNGYEVLRELRADAATKRLPVVLCTTKGTDYDKSWGMDMGADAYITKPFDETQLLNTVRRLL